MSEIIQSMSDIAICEELRTTMANTRPEDREFCRSLIANVIDRGFLGSTPKQRYWLEALLEKARNGEQARKKTQVGDFKGLTALFTRASRKLKNPAIVIGMAGHEIRLQVAGYRSRAPGTVNVTTNASFENRTWFGRILETGEFEASPRDRTPEGLIEGLQRFAADPAGVAAEHGKLTGRCCFCNLGLKDERSTSVGYGPTCAENYGLPYPTYKQARAVKAATLFEAAAA